MFVFLHIPKTAGSTLMSVIEHQHTRRWSRRLYYGDNSDEAHWHPREAARTILSLPQHQQAAAEVLYGHFHFGVHPYLPQPTTYYTVLRRPVERVVSHYYHILNCYVLTNRFDGKVNRHDYRRRFEQGHLGIEEYVSSGDCPELDNGQTRLLAGETGLYDRTPFGQCTEALLDEAKHNLREHIGVVGLTERFDESLLLIQRLCGWRTPYYVKQNVTERRSRVTGIPPSALAAIQRSNVFDQQLYEYGVLLFEERVAQQGPDFADDVRRFQERNRRYGRLNTRWNAVTEQWRRGTRFAGDRLGIHKTPRQAGASLDSREVNDVH